MSFHDRLMPDNGSPVGEGPLTARTLTSFGCTLEVSVQPKAAFVLEVFLEIVPANSPADSLVVCCFGDFFANKFEPRIAIKHQRFRLGL